MSGKPAAPPTRLRTLVYRRATWSEPAPWDLRGFVDLVASLPDTAARTFPYKGEFLTSLAWKTQAGKTFGHIVQWDKDKATSTVKDPSPALAETDTSELPPPQGEQFLDGDITFLATGNHLLLCPSGAREAVVDYYLRVAANQLGLETTFSRCQIEPVADIDKVRLIRSEGVKSVRLDSSLYAATMLYEEGQQETGGARVSIFRKIGGELFKLLGEDMGLPEITDKENVNIKLEISYDSRRKGGELGQRRMEGLAREVVEEGGGGDGFCIVTREGKTIRSDSLNVKSTVEIPISGNTVNRSDAWAALSRFYDQLLASGALET